MDALKPCPFCGGEASLIEFSDMDFTPPGADKPVTIPHVFVHCVECEGGHPPVTSRDEAVSIWNRRAA